MKIKIPTQDSYPLHAAASAAIHKKWLRTFYMEILQFFLEYLSPNWERIGKVETFLSWKPSQFVKLLQLNWLTEVASSKDSRALATCKFTCHCFYDIFHCRVSGQVFIVRRTRYSNSLMIYESSFSFAHSWGMKHLKWTGPTRREKDACLNHLTTDPRSHFK